MPVGLVRTEWSGTSGGPGLTQHAIMGAPAGTWNPGGEQGAVNAVRAFWAAIAAQLPNELQLSVSPIVDVYNEDTGILMASYAAATTPAVVPGTSASNYAAGAGLKVTWNTGSIRDGRRVRGSTYIVPAGSNVYDGNGRILPANQTTINTAASNMISALTLNGTPLGVWSRPRVVPTPRIGALFDVESGTCSSKTAILRGRRD
jgi:hypothetical protein